VEAKATVGTVGVVIKKARPETQPQKHQDKDDASEP